ncbi:MAG: carbohydrate kinase family protein, partial [Patescibacteria group bacterium]
MKKIFVSGSLAFDRIMNFPGYFKDNILPDKIHNLNVSFNIDQLRENFGGTAGNIAYNLSLLDVKSTVIG